MSHASQLARRTTLTLLIILATTITRASAADWMRFRGPNGSGVAADAHPPITWSETQNLQWKTPLPGPGTSSPIVVGSRIFVTCYSGYGDETDFNATPALAGPQIFPRSNRFLYCIASR